MYIYGKNVAKEKLQSNDKINKAYVSKKFKDNEILDQLFKRNIRVNFVDNIVLDSKVDGLHQGIILDIDEFKTYELNEFLDDLKMKNYVCAIATASGLDNIRFHYENLKLYKWFDWNNIIYNDYSFKGKPSPEIYEKCIQNLNLKKDECIVFEDSISGIIAAKNAGVYKVVAINKNKMLSDC